MSAGTRWAVGREASIPLNRAALAASVAEQTGLTAAKAGDAVDAMLGTIQLALQGGREVRLTGFGSFTLARRKASSGRNPRTGEAIEIGPSVSVKFKPGRTLKEAVGEEGG
jgi:DNA-binding protein HU-beta